MVLQMGLSTAASTSFHHGFTAAPRPTMTAAPMQTQYPTMPLKFFMSKKLHGTGYYLICIYVRGSPGSTNPMSPQNEGIEYSNIKTRAIVNIPIRSGSAWNAVPTESAIKIPKHKEKSPRRMEFNGHLYKAMPLITAAEDLWARYPCMFIHIPP